MSGSRYIDRICIAVIIAALIITVLFMNGEALGITAIVDEDAEAYEGTAYFTANDQNGAWSTDGATVITLNGDGADISGNGAYVYGSSVVIGNGGKYVISGTLSDGSIIVDAYSSSKVFIMLAGVDITCSDSAGIRVDEAEKVFLTLADGSVNTVVCGEEYSDDAVSDGISGAVFARDDLTINGSGSLSVTGAYKHGIVAKDDLVITGGTITVSAARDGIRANDSLRIMDAAISVQADDDGVVINKENGYFYMESGSLSIDSADDGVHSAGDVKIVGGDITISAADDGIHSDTGFLITGGAVTINECYEGIEAVTIDIEGGDILIYPTDDGLNANGGSSDAWGMGGGMQMRGDMSGRGEEAEGDEETDDEHVNGDFGQQEMPSEMMVSENESSDADDSEEDSEDTYVRISGGTLTIINSTGQDADGIDSNKDLIITGGTVRVSLVNNGNNSALDYGSESGGVAEISGGTVIACGNSSMAEQFDSSSSQASILYTISTEVEAGTTVAVEDTAGNVLISYEAPLSFSSVNISFPELTVGESYVVVIGDETETITIDEVSASYGSSAGGGFGGMGDRGNSGGGGRGHGGFSRNQSEDGEMPEAPDMGEFDGDMSEAPDMSEFDGEMPEAPDMSEFDGEMPEALDMNGFDGEMPGGEGRDVNDEADDETTVTTYGTALSELDADVWVYLAVAAIVLAAGLVFGFFYNRRRGGR